MTVSDRIVYSSAKHCSGLHCGKSARRKKYQNISDSFILLISEVNTEEHCFFGMADGCLSYLKPFLT